MIIWSLKIKKACNNLNANWELKSCPRCLFQVGEKHILYQIPDAYSVTYINNFQVKITMSAHIVHVIMPVGILA